MLFLFREKLDDVRVILLVFQAMTIYKQISNISNPDTGVSVSDNAIEEKNAVPKK